jgi:hypothetical protein
MRVIRALDVDIEISEQNVPELYVGEREMLSREEWKLR